MHGSITDEDRNFVETWENIGPGTTGIIRLDPRGDEKHEMISGKRNFKITTEERMITQDRITMRELDPFMNGTFRPVIVPDSVTSASNPNALSEDEIKSILNSSDIAWEEWLANIDSVATLRRMMEIADEGEEISLKRYRAMETRLAEVRPNRITVNDPHLQAFIDPAAPGKSERYGAGNNTATSGAGNPRRQQGGRSDDYR